MDDQRTDRTSRGDLTRPPDSGWHFVGIVYDGDPIDVCGVNPWDFEWKQSADQEPVIVAHPQYPSQRHRMFRWEINDGNKTIKFAAGEFSNLVWGFYVPATKK